MNNYEIIDISKSSDDYFYTVRLSDSDGLVHTEKLSSHLLVKCILKGIGFKYDAKNVELANNIANDFKLGYAEILHGEENGKHFYDVYIHEVLKEEGKLERMNERFLGTFEVYTAALNQAVAFYKYYTLNDYIYLSV